MSRPRLVLAVDIDEVLAAFVPSLAEFHNSKYATKLDASSFVSYEFHKVWGGSAAECSDKMTAFFASEHFLEGVRPVPGARESLTQLCAELPELELHCVTARQNKLETHTRAWIEAHYPGLFTDIHFGNHYSTSGVSRSKPDMCRAISAFALVDDSVVYAKQCAAAGIPVVLFGNYAWNSDIDLSIAEHAGRVTRAESWGHAVATLRGILERGLPTPPPVSPLLLASYLLPPEAGRHCPPKVAAVQMCTSHDRAANLATITRLVEAAATAGAALVCLPEACLSLGRSAAESVDLAEAEGGALFAEICALARRFQVWLSFCLAVREGSEDGKVRNRHVLVDCLGEVSCRYDKVHLFDSPLAGLCESTTTTPGEELVCSSDSTPLGRIGLAICYDVRFPQLFAALSARGAEVLLVPSAFTVTTGEAHWEVLLRARAIENQAFVVAAAQGGAHHKDVAGGGRVSYGHTMVIDPWGRVLARAEGANSQREGFVLCSIDPTLVSLTRDRMPVLQHRRPDVYY